jgi:hypothetical protein
MANSNKILLALQFWEGDRAAAMKLAQFLANIEPKHSDLADFILVRRFDCLEPKEYRELIPALSRKFNVFSYRSPRRLKGWPSGCNGVFCSSLEWARSMIEARRTPQYKAIFTFEADGAPLFPDWISRMSAQWDAVNKKQPVHQAGPLVKDPAPHVNGNCLMSGNVPFLKWLVPAVDTLGIYAGWDFALRDKFKEWGWANIHQMRSYYAIPTVSESLYSQMVEEQLIWVHGPKDDSMIRQGRERLL